jgi:S-layer protein
MTVSQSLLNQVQSLYIAFYDRPADLGGLNYWAGVVANNSNGNVQGILQDFAQSQESQNLYGTITSSNVGTVINQIYLNLFNRGVDSTGLQYWTNAYNTYHMSAGELAYYILNGAQGTDTTTIYNKLYAANVFTQTMANNYTTDLIPTAHNFVNAVTATTDLTQITPSSVNSYTQSFQTFNLTTGVDTLVGSNPVNNVFNGTYSTWGPGDSITGAQGANNTFNLTDDRSSSSFSTPYTWILNPAFSSVSGVQNVNVASQSGVNIDTTDWSGLTNLNIKANANSTVAGNNSVTAAATTNINFTDSNLGGNTDTITGGQNVVVNEYKVTGGTVNVDGINGTQSVSVTQTGNAYATVNITDANSNAATPSLGTITTISLDGLPGANNTIVDNNLQTLTVNDAAAGATVTINDNSAVSGVPTALTLNANNDSSATITESDSNSSKGQYTTLNVVTGAKNSNLALSGFNAATALNVSGSSTLTLSSLTTTTTPVLSTVAISGAAGFTATDTSGGVAVLPTSLTSITDSSSGMVTVLLPTNSQGTATTASFNGSTATGQEIVAISQPLASTASIKGGTATNNELVILSDASSNFPTNNKTPSAINSFGTGTISGFEVLGISDNSPSGNNFDIAALGAQLGSFNNTIDLHEVSGTDTLYNVANNSTLQFHDTGIYNTVQVYNQSTLSTMDVNLSHSSAGNQIYIGTLNLSYAPSSSVGAATLNITDTGISNSINSDTILTLTDNTLTTLNINSNNNFTIGILNDSVTSPVSINLSGAGVFNLGSDTLNTPTLTITDNSTSAKATTITALTDNALNTLNFAGTHAAGIAITTLIDSATALTIANTGTGTASIDNFTSLTLTSLTLTGNVAFGTLSSSGVPTVSITDKTGFTLAGATDNASVILSLTDAATAAHTNNIALGNGDDTLILTSDASNYNITNKITVGTGTNAITLNDTNNGTTTTVTDIIKFADNSSLFNGTDHLTTVTLGSSTPATNVYFDFSLVLGSTTPLLFDATVVPVTATTLAGALAQADTAVHNAYYNAGYFTYGSNTYLFADSSTNSGHQAIIELVGTHTIATTSTADVVHVLT